MTPVPVFCAPPVVINVPHVVPESSLLLPDPLATVIAKKQLPEGLPLRIVLVTAAVPPPWLLIPFWLLLAIVSWFRVMAPSSWIPENPLDCVIVVFVIVACEPASESTPLLLLDEISAWSSDSIPPFPPAGGEAER